MQIVNKKIAVWTINTEPSQLIGASPRKEFLATPIQLSVSPFKVPIREWPLTIEEVHLFQ